MRYTEEYKKRDKETGINKEKERKKTEKQDKTCERDRFCTGQRPLGSVAEAIRQLV